MDLNKIMVDPFELEEAILRMEQYREQLERIAQGIDREYELLFSKMNLDPKDGSFRRQIKGLTEGLGRDANILEGFIGQLRVVHGAFCEVPAKIPGPDLPDVDL